MTTPACRWPPFGFRSTFGSNLPFDPVTSLDENPVLPLFIRTLSEISNTSSSIRLMMSALPDSSFSAGAKPLLPYWANDYLYPLWPSVIHWKRCSHASAPPFSYLTQSLSLAHPTAPASILQLSQTQLGLSNWQYSWYIFFSMPRIHNGIICYTCQTWPRREPALGRMLSTIPVLSMALSLTFTLYCLLRLFDQQL